MEAIIGYLAGAGAIISVLVQLLKKTTIPTDRPKLVTTIIAIVVVVAAYLLRGQFTVENIDAMIASIAAIVGLAVGFYEVVIKPVFIK